MEAPMSDWFRAIPLALDSIAYSVKFQQEMMAAQIISLRSRCQQQRMLIDRLKAENLDLKKYLRRLRVLHGLLVKSLQNQRRAEECRF